MDHQKKVVRPLNPIEKANILSVLTFSYTIGLFKKCYKKEIDNNDVYDTVPAFSSKYLGDKLEKVWLRESVDRQPSILKVLLRFYGPGYFVLGLIQLSMRSVVIFLQPKAIGKLVAYFVPNQTSITFSDACYYGFIVIGLNLVTCIYNHNYMQYITEYAMRVRIGLTSLLYRKALSINSTSLSQITVGKIVTLMTKDVFSFDSALVFMNDLWIGLIITSIFAYLVYVRVGFAVFAIIGFFICVIPLQVFLGKKTIQMRLKTAKKTDERLQVTQETLTAMKIIKMYTWEKFFERHTINARRDEVNQLKKIYYVKTLNMVIGGLIQKVSFYILAMTYIWMGNNLTAELAFFLISCFQSLRSYLTISIPLGISQTAELIASLKRIQIFLNAKETDVTEDVPVLRNPLKPRVLLKNVAIELNGEKILKNVSLKIEHGHLMIVGPVGCGKSSLLKTILKDYSICEGIIDVQGRISYAPQEPWLFPSTIRQNITFGLKFDKERYDTVLKVCGLVHDIKQFDKGDQTIVGDNAINLSKGQQARINLARAVYRDSDIYLLDDCLSALDATVSNAVFQECIRDFLKDKLVIMITHNTNHLKQAQNVLVMANGETLSLEQQNKMLDKRITYYIDEEDNEDYVFYDCENEDMEQDEHDSLLKPSTTTRNIYSEQKRSGQVEWKVYAKYYKYCGGILAMFIVALLFITCQFSISYTESLVSVWVNYEQNITMYKLDNRTNTTEYEEIVKKDDSLIAFYNIMIASWSILSLLRAYVFFYFASNASKNLHKSMATSVINSRMQFFDSHFIGNILNRFSKDLATCDEYLPYLIFENLRLFSQIIGIFALIIMVNKHFVVVIAILLVVFYSMRKMYLPTGRALKRLDASTRSPMIGHLNSTLEGLTTIRAYETQPILKKEFDKHHDLFTSTYYMMQCSARAFGFFLDMFCCIFIASIISYFLFIQKTESAGSAGLAISQAFMLTGFLQWAIRQWSELETQMTSVERVLEYTNIKTENKGGLTEPNWPKAGRIQFNNVRLTYNNAEEVLKNVSFDIQPKQRVGIVGRTGAGKSSIISSLFRLYEVDGKITIDNVDIKTLNLKFLRSKIGIIPQDPVLFSGTLRTNIDPIKRFSDDEIWRVVKSVKLESLIQSLDYKITESGSNFSTGEKQLICLARALVSQNKIIILDEATANMDTQTDSLIQNIIMENFKDCTVIIIAHKLVHILKCDQVMVVDDGKVVEYGTPDDLLHDPDGLFSKMIRRAGIDNQK